jgi:hypothetical protein
MSDQPQVQLPEWQCHKRVWADKIVDVVGDTSEGEAPCNAALILACGGRVQVDRDYCRKHLPEVGGYWVRYADGYESYSPAKAFEEGYTRL